MLVHTTAVVLTAAGTSKRFGTGQKKEYRPLTSHLFPNQKNTTVLSCSAEAFLSALDGKKNGSKTDAFVLTRLIVTVPPCNSKKQNDAAQTEQSLLPQTALLSGDFVPQKLTQLHIKPEFVAGGADRQTSVLHALEHLERSGKTPDIVLIHDAARPFVQPQTILDVLQLTLQKGAACPALSAVDTYKETDDECVLVVRHLERSRLAAVQTPQGFFFKELLGAHRRAQKEGLHCTDDTQIWSAYAGTVYLCEGKRDNIKITYKEDLKDERTENKNCSAPCFRTGLGWDTHRLVSGRSLIIGGITIPFDKGELAHSDGDVLFHAITDALLGAAALGDIGELFPPSQKRWKNADSALLLGAAWDRVTQNGWQLENLDCVLIIERPKLLAYRERIRENIASVLNCGAERIFIKAKTAEGMGDIGQGNAVSAFCTCLLQKK